MQKHKWEGNYHQSFDPFSPFMENDAFCIPIHCGAMVRYHRTLIRRAMITSTDHNKSRQECKATMTLTLWLKGKWYKQVAQYFDVF